MVFHKTKTVPFSNKNVYGKQFKPGLKLVFPVVAKMLFDNKINITGGINSDNADGISRDELFSYIYYLWVYNKSNISPFTKLHDSRGLASGDLFYNTIKQVITDNPEYNVRKSHDITAIDISGLIYFINKTVNDNYGKIIIPVVDHLNNLLKEESKKSFDGVTIKTGKFSNNMRYQAEVLTDINSNNSDIKIKFVRN